jgi:hypothetical protein
MGQAIAKGHTTFVLPPDQALGEDDQLQARYFARMQAAFPVLALKPSNEEQHRHGVEQDLETAHSP